jgi:signal transduction histidine kinase
MEEVEKWKARFERERKSRKEAEKLLEEKSAELFELNESLKVKVEEELEKNREKELIVLQQSKMASMGEMIGNIAHQWRQPLSAISTIASAQIVNNELGLSTKDELNKSLEDIVEHTQFLSNTIDDFRNFFRNDKEYVHFKIEDLVEKCLNVVAGVLHTKSVKVIKNIEDIELFSLKNEFMQVLLNLVKNAIDAMEDVFDDDAKYIFISAYKKDGMAVINVKDTAEGIPKSIIDKIFEPYFTTKHQSQGTGIGLFMTNEIIRKHMKGTIYVENVDTEVDGMTLHGASFTIEIPLEY